jgi:hypothetical protein
MQLRPSANASDHTGLSAFIKTEKPKLVAHTCNPSYSRGSDQEDHGSRDPISKNIQYKSELVMEWLKVKALSSSPHSAKIKRHKFRPW